MRAPERRFGSRNISPTLEAAVSMDNHYPLLKIIDLLLRLESLFSIWMDGGVFRESLVLKNVAVSSFDLFTGTVLSWGPVTGLLNHVILFALHTQLTMRC